MWTILSAFWPFLPGHWLTHTSHPVQSAALICIVYFNPSNPFPIGAKYSASFGALASSSAVTKNGLITAWGQANEHWLHWIQFSLSHTGTKLAM